MLTASAAAAARSSSSRKAAVAAATSFIQLQQKRNISKDIRFGSDARMQMLAGIYCMDGWICIMHVMKDIVVYVHCTYTIYIPIPRAAQHWW